MKNARPRTLSLPFRLVGDDGQGHIPCREGRRGEKGVVGRLFCPLLPSPECREPRRTRRGRASTSPTHAEVQFLPLELRLGPLCFPDPQPLLAGALQPGGPTLAAGRVMAEESEYLDHRCETSYGKPPAFVAHFALGAGTFAQGCGDACLAPCVFPSRFRPRGSHAPPTAHAGPPRRLA